MLAADRQLLDAHLRNELQQLRRLEITNIVNRFQSALTPATLIAGFSMVGISALDFTTLLGLDHMSRIAEPVFYLSTATSLASSLYVTAVATVGIVFGQRLTIQATADQGRDHDMTVQELNSKFVFSLIALGFSMALVVVAATAVIWVKDPTSMAMSQVPAAEHASLPGNYYASIFSTIIAATMFLFTAISMCQMFFRLHTPTPADSDLRLRQKGGKEAGAEASEFFIAGSAAEERWSARRG